MKGHSRRPSYVAPHFNEYCMDSAINISRAPGSVIWFVDRARRGVAPIAAPIAIVASSMTAEAVCEANMIASDARPAHCAGTTYAEPAHMGSPMPPRHSPLRPPNRDGDNFEASLLLVPGDRAAPAGHSAPIPMPSRARKRTRMQSSGRR
jgi:hypothetical protein